MPSQIAHTLAGLCGYALVRKRLPYARQKWLFLGSLVLANLADIDLLLGTIVGDYDRFHGQATHSILAVVVVGLLLALVARSWTPNHRIWVVWGGGVYLSHILLDMVGGGVQLVWPFSQAFVGVPLKIFGPWELFNPLLEIFKPLLNSYVFAKVATRVSELIVMTPFVILAWYAGTYLSTQRDR